MSIWNRDLASQVIGDLASSSRAGLDDFGTQVERTLNSWRNIERRGVDSLLDRMGLQRRPSILRPVLWAMAGAVLGGCVVHVLAPRAGETIRVGIEKLRQARDWAGSRASEAAATVNSAVHHANNETHESA
ncbi:MAG TPA: hypothetical protein VGM06_16680 [Polyangiaceae bacterium]|jgi:hypothetical protein